MTAFAIINNRWKDALCAVVAFDHPLVLNMKYSFILSMTALILLSGCINEDDYKAFQKDIDERIKYVEEKSLSKDELLAFQENTEDRLATIEQFTSHLSQPLKFEVHQISLDGLRLSGVIRCLDDRIKSKTLYLELKIDVIHSGNKLVEEEDYLYVSDGIGKLDYEFWFSSDTKKDLFETHISEKNIEFSVTGWGELFPGTIEKINSSVQ